MSRDGKGSVKRAISSYYLFDYDASSIIYYHIMGLGTFNVFSSK